MYKTISEIGEAEQVINKSSFIATAFPISCEEDAVKFIQAERKKHPDARHVCWAYILGEKKDIMRYSDDGEPQGTAGQPILQVLVKKDITNVLVTVTRYFGGILLGAGGLTRAYSSSCVSAIDNTGVKTMVLSSICEIVLDYTTYNRLQKTIENSDYIIVKNIAYGENVTLTLTVKQEDFEKLSDYFIQSTGGKAKVIETEKIFLPW
jgi:uncharacterized YigZ family protein